jgi:peptide deformylase
MAKLPILTFPAKSLKETSVPVEEVTSRITDLVKDMFETMYDAQGIGLAAPQIGENINLLVMDVKKPDPIDDEKEISNPICLINPEIIQSEGIMEYEEGCLSCPELLVMVERAQSILVKALDAEGRPIEHKLTDLEAVCTQHEMDHLKGMLLTDYISRLKRDIYRKQRVRLREDEDDTGDV